MRIRSLVILFIYIFLSAAGSACAAFSPEERQSLFAQGNEAFKKANVEADNGQSRRLYEKAILNYERLINEGGIRNAKLYYNLANAYLLTDDVGRAILNYRRAEKLDEGDYNIQKNLEFARSRRIDKIDVQAQEKVMQTLFFWHYDLSMKTRFLLACVFFGSVCAALTMTIWRGARAWTSVLIVVGGILLISVVASVIAESNYERNRVCGVITAAEAVARQGDGPNYPESFKEALHAGTEFELAEQRPGWLHIMLSDGSEGWIAEDTAEVI